MNIGALQSMMGMHQVSSTNMQNGSQANSKFGAIFAGVSSKTPKAESPTNGEIPIESIPNLFNASTVEGLESAVKTIQGNEIVAIGSTESLEEIASWLSINPEEMLKKLQQLLEEAGISKGETEELNISADMWTLLNMIDEAGIRFFKNLNEELQKPGTRNEATQLLSLLKTIELLAPKSDMDLWMEQKVDSFRQMITAAAGQFEQRMATAGRQEQLPFLNQKNEFRIVLETNSSTSANAEGSGQKQADPTPQSGAVHATTTVVRSEMPLQQAESNPANRSETLLREMQALMKRSNFGQVGGTNRMLIKLYPEHLGQIRIELLETNGVMTARILASTALAKGMLDSQLHQLKHAFNQQNLQVDRVDIAQTIQESHRNEREQSFNEQFKREQQKDDNKQNQSPEDELSFEEYMIELEV
ncbi:flagellar hook-length control protein FliK [Saccharococcus sp. Marseille-Q5394]|uniref:flagellar hook-length control protein FliK n=1 Tax=Saccharococcus sp. Marseille-Q5394 TaxID=2972778 RepID=UPI0021C6AF15|nr:flagellar hook-length control protein FliK [Saccharococcus sp. Marseille-Q5394]